ncbi:MAG: AI-2E family transporter [Saprospiraceae bacterium]|nr:AI-2E family transporter [Saprospiraceae bacterium]
MLSNPLSEAEMSTPDKIPTYLKASLLLIGFYYFVNMLSIGQEIILPVMYAAVIAILVSPIVDFLVKKKLNRVISIAVVLLVSFIIIGAFIALLSSQASRFTDALPRLVDKFQELLDQCIAWISEYFNISVPKIDKWIDDAKTKLMDNSNSAISSTISTMGGVLATAFLTPVYVFMLLFYKPHLVEFTHRVFGYYNDGKVTEILTETKLIIKSYLVGLFIEFIILAILNSTGLLILGIEYAIILGVLGALLNVIPYLGGAITVVLFMFIALVTKSPIYVLYVFLLYATIQFIDNNYIVPKVVGSKVQLNALVSLFAVIVGAALWGIPGMFLSIPIAAVLKVVLDRTDSLKPWGFLLGETLPPMIKLKLNIKDITEKLPFTKPKPKG